MRRLAAGVLTLVACVAAGAVSDTAAGPAHAAERALVAYVIDGDTIALASGYRVRLLQIDTPEPGTAECFSLAAGRELRRLLPVGAAVTLERDPRLDGVDRYGRLLRYVRRGAVNVNVEMVRRGAATVWFYEGDQGRYASRLLAAGTTARRAHRGIWGACPAAVWNPLGPATTGPGSPPSPAQPRPVVGGGRCDPSYPTVCIPPPPPDLDCGDVPHVDFRVRPPDPHHFDGEGDGLGCEG
jgi:micrococcal nuclease